MELRQVRILHADEMKFGAGGKRRLRTLIMALERDSPSPAESASPAKTLGHPRRREQENGREDQSTAFHRV